MAKIATRSVPSLAAVTGSLPQSARPSPGAHVSPRRRGDTNQLNGCFRNGSLRDLHTLGPFKIALADTLIPIEVKGRILPRREKPKHVEHPPCLVCCRCRAALAHTPPLAIATPESRDSRGWSASRAPIAIRYVTDGNRPQMSRKPLGERAMTGAERQAPRSRSV